MTEGKGRANEHLGNFVRPGHAPCSRNAVWRLDAAMRTFSPPPPPRIPFQKSQGSASRLNGPGSPTVCSTGVVGVTGQSTPSERGHLWECAANLIAYSRSTSGSWSRLDSQDPRGSVPERSRVRRIRCINTNDNDVTCGTKRSRAAEAGESRLAAAETRNKLSHET